MTEYIVKETAYPLATRQEVVGELIRCKDCKFASPNKIYGCILERFSLSDKNERLYADDFCSRAERRTDEDGGGA